MANDQFEKLVVQLSADLRGYQNAMARATGITNSRAREIENRYKRMSASINSAITAPLAGIGAALSVREITQYADAWTSAGNMIAAAAQSAGVQTRSLEELRRGADDARTSLGTYADLYAKLIRSASGVAKSEEEIALATSLVSKAMKAGGAAVSEQQAAILQLGQALGSGVLQGDELRSLRENAPIVAQAIADEFGVTIAGLKKLGEEGKLTSDRVFQAIIKAQAPIEAQFAKTNQTIADGLTRLGNAVTEYIGKAFEASGATAAINSILGALAGNIEAVGAAAAAAGAIILSRYVPAMARAGAAGTVALATNPFLALAAAIGAASFAMAAFGDEIKPVEDDLANLQDYAGTIWDGITDAATEAGSAVADAFIAAVSVISESLTGLPVTWADVAETIKGVLNTLIGAHVAAFNAIKAVFDGLPAAVADGVISAVNYVIEKIEWLISKVATGLNVLIDGLNNIPGVELTHLNTEFDLGEVKNKYKGAGKELGEAVTSGIQEAMAKDYLGDAFNAVRDEANQHAFERTIGNAIDSAPTTTTAGYGGGMDIGSDDGGKSGGGKGSKGRRQRKDELEREIEQIQKRTAALVAETAAQEGLNPVLEDYGYAAERARAVQELLSAAQEAGIDVTPQLREQIEGLAEAYAQASVASEQLDEANQRIRDRAGDMEQLRAGTTQGLLQDLLDGKSAADAFADALGRVGDRLIDLAINDIFSSGGGAARGGLLGGRIIPGILHSGGVAGRDGYGHGRAVSPGVFAGASRYHSGGVAGLRPGEVPAILQRGEVVIPKGGFGRPSGGTAVNLTFAPTVDARGADAGAVARLDAAMRAQATEMKATFNSRVVSAVRDPRRR